MMAVTDPTVGGVHFDPARFDALIATHGQAVELRRASRCPCWDPRTGQRDPAHGECYPFGVLYDAPETLTAWGPMRKRGRRYEPAGELDEGDVTFTFPTGTPVPVFSRIVLPGTTLVVDDLLTKGSADVIRYGHVLAVEQGRYRRQVSEDPYEVEAVELAIEDVGTPPPDAPAIRVVDRRIEWLDATIPDGTRYVLRFRTHSEWVVWEPQERSEGGQTMPYRYVAKRLDYLLHPRGEEARDFAQPPLDA